MPASLLITTLFSLLKNRVCVCVCARAVCMELARLRLFKQLVSFVVVVPLFCLFSHVVCIRLFDHFVSFCSFPFVTHNSTVFLCTSTIWSLDHYFFLSFSLLLLLYSVESFLLLYSNSFNQKALLYGQNTVHRHISNLLSKFQSIWLRLCYMIANGNPYAHAVCRCWCNAAMHDAAKKEQRHSVFFLSVRSIFAALFVMSYCVCVIALFHPLVQLMIITTQ